MNMLFAPTPASPGLRSASAGKPENPPVRPAFGKGNIAMPVELDILEAVHKLGKEQVTFTLHGVSFPSAPGENTGIGSPFSNGAKQLVSFLRRNGFNRIQLGPGGKVKPSDVSPYMSSSFSANPLFIDLAQLAREPQWAGLLSGNTFQAIVDNNPQKGQNRVAYDYAFKEYEKAFDEVFSKYNNLKVSKDSLDPDVKNAVTAIENGFEDFKAQNTRWLEKEGLYEALTLEHGNDYYGNWPEPDRNLFKPGNPDRDQRIGELKQKHGDAIERYNFIQYIASAQKLTMQKAAQAEGIRFIADSPVAFSAREVWAYPDAFIDDLVMGAPPDYFDANGQGWGFPVLDPNRIYHSDGSLDVAGQLIKAKFDKIFEENQGGVRLDHIIGWVDPWVYPPGGSPKDDGFRLMSSPEHAIGKHYAKIPQGRDWSKLTPDELESHAEMLGVIVQSAKDKGVPVKNLIAEDLGSNIPPSVFAVMKKFGIGGIRVTQYAEPHNDPHMHRGKNIPANHTAYIGSHDNKPLWPWMEELKKSGDIWNHARYLAYDLAQDKSAGAARKREKQASSWARGLFGFAQAKFAELFASPPKSIQFFFTDVLGMTETFNIPGTQGDHNWSLRMPDDFEAFFKSQLKQRHGMKTPQALALAMRARGDAFVKANQPLIERLEKH